MTINALSVVLSATSSPANAYARITCFTRTYGTPLDCGTPAINSLGTVVVSGDRQYTTFRWATSSVQLTVGKVYVVEFLTTSGTLTGIYGVQPERVAGDCSYGGFNYCHGTIYEQFNSSINWGAYSSPLIFSTSSQAIATSSPLWGQLSTSSISVCDDAGNIFSTGICVAFSFLFLPNPDVLTQWSQLPQVIYTKFPFSWIVGVQTEFSSLAASSTANLPTYSYDLHALGIGSTTAIGNILPTYTGFSSTTVLTYVSPALWSIGQTLIGATLWLLLGFDIYSTVRRRHAHV